MSVQKFSVFEAISQRMDWLSKRQTVLADNIANADTPGYAPQDLQEPEFQNVLRCALRPTAPQVTHPGHVNASAPERREPRSEEAREKYETAPSGNAVVIEEQLVKVSENQMNYQTMASLYRKHMQMFLTALGGGGGGAR